MEIERKYRVKQIPEQLEQYKILSIEQAYLCRNPVVRIRKQEEEYFLTYKSDGMMVREEYNMPLTEESYEHLKEKADGNIITKKRHLIPIDHGLTVELDVFEGIHKGLVVAEVEFPDEKTANEFKPLDWFGEDVTFDLRYHNSRLSEK